MWTKNVAIYHNYIAITAKEKVKTREKKLFQNVNSATNLDIIW